MEDGDVRFSNLSISELISILRTSFRMSVFDNVEKVLVAREKKLKQELDWKEKECEFLRRRKKKLTSSLDEENDKRFELEHAKKGVKDKRFWKRREPWASLLQKYYPKTSDWEGDIIKKFETSSEQFGGGIGEMIGEEEVPEKCKNENANSAEGKNGGKVTDSDKKEQIATAATFYKGVTSSRTSKVDHVKNLQKKPGVKRKCRSFANSSDEIVNIDDDDDDEITESSKPSKKPQESNTDPGVILVEASSCRLNGIKKMNTWTKQGATSSKVCEEHSLLKPIPRSFCLDSDDDEDSLDDSSSSSDTNDDDIHPLLRKSEGMV